ncbi:helix-turn-helix domain-containing protein [Streptosporangium sp. NPDC000563]|uniref:helix-turn-helix domain-containing protein n=1 Tax=Streptosporangium sp. NPDC000563 TaxID=3154366 RepID=UPI003323BEC4
MRTDNRPENLEPLTADEHSKRHESPYAAEMLERYSAGQPTTKIATDLGLDVSHVFRVLQRRGVTFRTSGDYLPPLDPQQIAAWHAAGVRVREMARRSGRSPKAINALLDELGLPRFRPGRPFAKQGTA